MHPDTSGQHGLDLLRDSHWLQDRTVVALAITTPVGAMIADLGLRIVTSAATTLVTVAVMALGRAGQAWVRRRWEARRRARRASTLPPPPPAAPR